MFISVNLPTSGRRAVKQQNNRDAILDAARDVFAEIDYGNTTVRGIIRRTNLTMGTFYNYFDSKEAVFNGLSDKSAHNCARSCAMCASAPPVLTALSKPCSSPIFPIMRIIGKITC